MKKSRNYSIDLCKWIASLFVIGIHVALFKDIHDSLYFFMVEILFRQAVPFFAICSGYFFAFNPAFLKQWKKLIILYGVWSILYLVFSIPSWIDIGWFGIGAFVDYGIVTILKASHYHLWYLLSVIYALPLLYVCLKKISYRYYGVIAGVLYTVKVLMYGYRTRLPETVARVFAVFDKFSGMTDAIFCVLPFMLLGAYICKSEKKSSLHTWIRLVVSFVALIAEASILSNTGQTSVSYILFTMPTAFYMFQLIVNARFKSKWIDSKQLGAISLLIYCVHPMLVELLEEVVSSSIILFILVAVLSTAFGLIFIILKERVSVKTLKR